MTWPRFIVGAVIAMCGVTAYALYDLAKTLDRAVRLPEEADDN